jgi:hypothetical protein
MLPVIEGGAYECPFCGSSPVFTALDAYKTGAYRPRPSSMRSFPVQVRQGFTANVQSTFDLPVPQSVFEYEYRAQRSCFKCQRNWISQGWLPV